MRRNRQLALERRQARLQDLSQAQQQGKEPTAGEQGGLTALMAFLGSAGLCNSHILTEFL